MKICFIIFFILGLGGANAGATSLDSEQKRYAYALTLLEENDFQNALDELHLLSTEFRLQENVSRTFIVAYLGACTTLNIYKFKDAMMKLSGTPFQILLQTFSHQNTSVAYCFSAQELLEERWGSDATKRPDDVNFMMAFAGAGRAGIYLSDTADKNSDGRVDPEFSNACTTLSDHEAKNIGTGLGLMINNYASLLSEVGSRPITENLRSLKAFCGPACSISSVYSEEWNSKNKTSIRSVIESKAFGILSCEKGMDCCTDQARVRDTR